METEREWEGEFHPVCVCARSREDGVAKSRSVEIRDPKAASAAAATRRENAIVLSTCSESSAPLHAVGSVCTVGMT